MPSPPADPWLRLFAEEPFVRELARALVGGDPDDVVQQTFLRALGAPRADLRQPRAWLARIVRTVASNLRRDASRRVRRERAVAASERVPSSAELLVREEQRQRLVRAVDALPPDLRAVVLLRWFEALPPRRIAKEFGLPVATVWNRLRSGLALLRERLDAEHGGDRRAWALPLAAFANGLPPAPVAGGGILVGGALVTIQTKMAVAFGAVAVLALAFVCWPKLFPAGPDAPPRGPGPAAVASAPAPPHEDAPATAAEAREPVPESRDGVAPPPDVVFAGRCVDADDGRPLAGVAIALTPQPLGEIFLGPALLRADADPPPAARAESGADGRFELAARSSRTFYQSLSFEAPDRVRVEGTSRAAHGRVELGDVALAAGVTASARVVDADGTPQPDLLLWIVGPRAERTKDGLASVAEIDARSRADGSVPVPGRMLPGRWTVVCRDREVIGPKEWTVAGGAPPFDIVVNGKPESIAGTVTDPQGLPLTGVAVQPVQRESYMGAVPISDAEGRFTVRRWSTDRPAPHRLLLTRPGWRALQTEPVAWRTQDLHYTLQPARALDLLVVDDASGAPIGTFGVRMLWPQDVQTDWRSMSGEVVLAGRHDGGRVRLLLDDGPHRLYVQAAGDTHAAGGPLDVVAGAAMPAQLTVRLLPLARRTLRVVTAAGQGLAGSTVELLRGGAQEQVWDRDDLQWNAPWRDGRIDARPLRLARGTSGADGSVALAVPEREPLELRVAGPLHCPLQRSIVFADEPEPLPVVVAVGATVQGAIEPPDFGARLRRLAGGMQLPEPAVQLVQQVEQDQRMFPDKPVAIGRDGTFRIEHVPPGTWDVVAVVWLKIALGGTNLLLPVGSTGTLADAATAELRLDGSAFLPCTLHARVLRNGVPLARKSVTVRVESDLPKLKGRAGPSGFGVTTDADGCFAFERLPARYGVAVDGVDAPERVRVAPGASMDAVFTITAGTVVLTFVDAKGAPIAGACGIVIGSDDVPMLVNADAAGRVQLDRAPGHVRAGVLPAALRDGTARQEWIASQQDRNQALRTAALGIVGGEVAAGTELALRVAAPATAGY